MEKRSISIKILLLAVCCSFFWTFPPSAQSFPRFDIMTENWAPYNFSRDGKTQGIAVDLLVEMLKRAGSEQTIDDIKIVSWPRGYGLVTRESNTMLFSMTRTEEREKLFKWVGPIAENVTELIARKDKHIQISSIADIQKYKVATIIDDVGEQLLLGKGVPLSNLYRVVNRDQVQHLLSINRVDLSIGSSQGFRSFALAAGYNPDDYESVFVLNRDVISYAFHKETPDSVIQALQKALKDLKAEGIYDKIVEKYQEE